MRRLSIIDLPGGHQPVWNEARNVSVVFNGELYNYRELRQRLQLSGHRFSTNSDTEILVHGWEEWGEDLLGELRGMFAFALLDLRKHFATVPVLFLARDPLGIKPLYYAQTPRGSPLRPKLRAILVFRGSRSRDFCGRVDVVPIVWQRFGAGDDRRRGVLCSARTRAAAALPDRRRTPRVRPWWDPTQSAAARDVKRPRDFAAASARLRTLLEDAVRAHLIADVPVGLISFEWTGLERDRSACWTRATGHPKLHTDFPGYAV